MPIYIGGQKVANTNNSVGTVDINTNGTHDVTTKAAAVVNVPQGYQVESILKDDGTQKMVITNYADVEQPDATMKLDADNEASGTNFAYLVTELNLSNFNLPTTLTSLRELFSNMRNLTSILGIEKLDVSNITNMYALFSNCYALTSLTIKNWDVSNVTNMGQMFFGCTMESLDLSTWNTTSATDMGYMFYGRSMAGIKYINIENFNTSNVKDMRYMFGNNAALTTVNGTLDMGNATNASDMFYYCYGLETLPTMININVALYLHYSSKLTAEEIETKVLNGLVDLTGQTAKTFTLGTTLLAKLSDEQKAIATNKNWILA